MNTLPPNLLQKISHTLSANSLANLRESYRGGRNAVSAANVKGRLARNNLNRAIQNVLNQINFWNKPPKHRYLNYGTTPQQLQKIREKNARVYTKRVSMENKLRMVRELLRKVPTTGPGKATKWRKGLINRITERVGPLGTKIRIPPGQQFAISAPNQAFYRV